MGLPTSCGARGALHVALFVALGAIGEQDLQCCTCLLGGEQLVTANSLNVKQVFTLQGKRFTNTNAVARSVVNHYVMLM